MRSVKRGGHVVRKSSGKTEEENWGDGEEREGLGHGKVGKTREGKWIREDTWLWPHQNSSCANSALFPLFLS